MTIERRGRRGAERKKRAKNGKVRVLHMFPIIDFVVHFAFLISAPLRVFEFSAFNILNSKIFDREQRRQLIPALGKGFAAPFQAVDDGEYPFDFQSDRLAMLDGLER